MALGHESIFTRNAEIQHTPVLGAANSFRLLQLKIARWLLQALVELFKCSTPQQPQKSTQQMFSHLGV